MSRAPEAPDARPLPALLGLSDIVRRWIYTREGVRLLMRSDPEFPKHVAAVNGGRTRLWLEADVARYEAGRDHLFDPGAKHARGVHFYQRWMHGTGEAE